MPSTYLSLHYHLVFGTKDHEPVIDKTWRSRLHAYLGGVVTMLGGTPEAIGGVSDHVHLLVGLRATHCLADVMRELKSVSSGWFMTKLRSVTLVGRKVTADSPLARHSEMQFERTLISQEEHHRTRTFRDEYLELLKLSGVGFDPRYVF